MLVFQIYIRSFGGQLFAGVQKILILRLNWKGSCFIIILIKSKDEELPL